MPIQHIVAHSEATFVVVRRFVGGQIVTLKQRMCTEGSTLKKSASEEPQKVRNVTNVTNERTGEWPE